MTVYNPPTRGALRQAGAPPTKLSDEATRLDKLDADHFEKKALELALPTHARPALIVQSEVETIRTGYGTGNGRLDVITKITNKRLDYYTEAKGGGAPFDPMSDGDRKKCEAFFAAHGTRLASQPKVAPPNPLRPKDEPEKLIEQAKVDLTPTPAQIAGARADPAHVAADQAIVDAEKPKPQVAPAPTAQPAAAPALAPTADEASTNFFWTFGKEDTFNCQTTLRGALSPEKVRQHIDMTILAMKDILKIGGHAKAVGQQSAPAAAAGKPICPVHHTPMKASKKPGVWFCPKKDADDEYCEEKFTEPK